VLRLLDFDQASLQSLRLTFQMLQQQTPTYFQACFAAKHFCHLPFQFVIFAHYLTKEALEGYGDLKIGGQVIRTVKCADDTVLLAKEGMVLQYVTD